MTTMLIGSDCLPPNYADMGAYTRKFDGSAKFPNLNGYPAGIALHPSMNQQETDAETVAFLQQYNPKFITIKHEVNTGKKGSPTAYKGCVKWLVDMCLKAGVQTSVVEIYALWSEVHHVAKKIPSWTAYHDPSGGAKYIGWDCYRNIGDNPNDYPAPNSFFSIPLKSRDTCSLPLLIPELGAQRLYTDTNGSGLADWYSACIEYLRSEGCVAVAAWNNVDGNDDPRFVLKDTELWAWRYFMKNQTKMNAFVGV